ncbi:hypothetical protein PQ455_02890 [Sphingomonas naphthae]|uniref:Sacsin/Nov domain-containing protein n=1 Tax=Sphingomonas naphthae TaxID=1813468 RepID=A0ABY7TLV0_9SPHN|nr:hypothetical protein [Sphingomonas naphthae]WCT74195.1 hypothetical protein PQ455_02890 [Sphingomonas naphthae]
MTALYTTQFSIIGDLRNLLRDRYRGGFPVLKELLQNADDARATRFLIAAHPGFADAIHPLLRAPALIVANDGEVTSKDFAAMEKASGGSKGGDRATVGRFGLGQKAVFHLCDAFVALAWIDGTATPKVINPWEEIPEATTAATEWKVEPADDLSRLLPWLRDRGFAGKGMCVVLPLRSATLTPGANPGLWLAAEKMTPSDALASMIAGEEFAPSLCCLRHLGEVAFEGNAGARYQLATGATRLSSPDAAGGARRLGATWHADDKRQMVLIGREAVKPGGAADGVKSRLKRDDKWPRTRDYLDRPTDDKAEPHGAILLCRSPAAGPQGRLRLRWTVYLPVSNVAEADLPLALGDIDVLLHGHFFLSSARTELIDPAGESAESEWNRALLADVTLPLLLPVLMDALPGLGDDSARRSFLRALAGTTWWEDHGADACAGDALALSWIGSGQPDWTVTPAALLRPVPLGDATGIERLSRSIPDLKDWCERSGTRLCFGVPLAAEPVGWPDQELAEIVRLAGASAWTKPRTAETIAALLEDAAPIGPATKAALAASYRLALSGEENFASASTARRLATLLPAEQILPLPSSVENRALIGALARIPDILPVKAEWSPPPGPTSRPLDLVVALLGAAAPFVGPRSLGEQAAAMIASLLRLGPSLHEIAQHPDARNLKIVPATRLSDMGDEVLTLGDAERFGRAGLLFNASTKELSLFAKAVIQPPVLRIRGAADASAFPLGNGQPASLKEPLARARSYGDPVDCARLANILAEQADIDDLRRLCARDPDLPHAARLFELDRLPPALEPLASPMLGPGSGMRLIDPAIAGELSPNLKQRLEIAPINATQIGRWLIEQQRAGTLPALSETTAIALLISDIDDDVLRRLPVHRTTNGVRASVADGVRRGKAADIPTTLRPHVLLLDPWSNPDTLARENDLVPAWNWASQLDAALAAPDPSQHVAAIAAALASIELSGDQCERLRETAWVPIEGRATAPAEILDLEEAVDRALATLLGGTSPFATVRQLPVDLREDTVTAALTRHAILNDRASSLSLAADLAGEAGAMAPAEMIASELPDWRMIASAGLDLPVSGWPILATTMRGNTDDECVTRFASALHHPSCDDVAAVLQALAATEGQPSARRLHRALFQRHARELRDGDFLPAVLLVPSVSDRFDRADRLALSAAGVSEDYRLDPHYAASLFTSDEIPVARIAPAGTAEIPARLRAALAPLRDIAPDEAVQFALALLGRGPEIVALAREWEGQRSFADICADLDAIGDALAVQNPTIAERQAELRFEIAADESGVADVLSAAGTVCRVPLTGDGSTWLVDCQRLPEQRRDGVVTHPYRLSLAPLRPTDEEQVGALLQQFVHRLAPALLLGQPSQREMLREALGRYFKDDQLTLDQAIDDLRHVIDDRLRALKPGPSIRAALAKFDSTKRNDRDAAAARLWDFVTGPDAGPELLEAVRRKIHEQGYVEGRVLFELFQNADDACAYWDGALTGRFRVAATRDDEGAITRLRVVHWGRPVNHLGSDPEIGREREHYRDLANMLAIGHSAKASEDQTGRFGLGFKTVHMLSDSPGLASGVIAARISGGMVPVAWLDGRAEAAPYVTRGQKPTLLDLPIAAGCSSAAQEAWESFQRAAPWLPAIAPSISRIELDDVPQPFIAEVQQIADGVEVVTLNGTRSRRAFRLDLGGGFRMFLAFGAAGPEEIRDVPQFWRLVPLEKQDRHGAWLMEGPFTVDPGRTRLSDSPEDQRHLFGALGGTLGERLIALFDVIDGNWPAFAATQGLDPASREGFWDRLVQLLARDLDTGEPDRELHTGLRGLARLLIARPLVRVAKGNLVLATDIAFFADGAMTDSAIRQIAAQWPGVQELASSLVVDETLLRRLGIGNRTPLTLAGVVDRLLGDKLIAPALAAMLGEVIDSDRIQAFPLEEQTRLRATLRSCAFVSAEGAPQPILNLSFPQADGDEARRSAFAPLSGRLSPDYVGAAFKLAQLARAEAGYQVPIWANWAASAERDPDRLLAFLRYVAAEGDFVAAQLLKAARWLPAGQELLDYPPLAKLTDKERNTILLRAGVSLTAQPMDFDVESDTNIWSFTPIDSSLAFARIAEWWDDEGDDLRAAYDRAVYPEGFVPALLAEDDDEAWFTMLGLATFQTIGRIRPEASRNFIADGIRTRWWCDLARVRDGDDPAPFINRLEAWSDPWEDREYGQWRRCLVDLFTVARFLEQYRELFRKLPRIVKQEGPIGLRELLTVKTSPIAAKMGIVATPVAQSLGIGANWLIRELGRHGIYSDEQAIVSAPYGWASAGRVRRLFARLGLEPGGQGVDAGQILFEQAARGLGRSQPFELNGDLPLHILTTAPHRDRLNEILDEAGAIPWSQADD